MGQGDVDRILEAEPNRWFTVKEVASAMGVTRESARRCLILSHKSGFIRMEKVNVAGRGWKRWAFKAKNEKEKR